MLNLSQPFSHITAKFILDGKAYSISKFKVSFAQSVDFKGQPENEIKGGHLMVVLPQIADDNLYLWAKTPTLIKSGQVLFQTDLGISVLRLDFTNAYCVNLERNTSAFANTETALVLSPEIISMNGVEHNNLWRK